VEKLVDVALLSLLALTLLAGAYNVIHAPATIVSFDGPPCPSNLCPPPPASR
jgi:hypothetical protein